MKLLIVFLWWSFGIIYCGYNFYKEVGYVKVMDLIPIMFIGMFGPINILLKYIMLYGVKILEFKILDKDR